MKLTIKIILFLACGLFLCGTEPTKAQTQQEIDRLQIETEGDLQMNILHFWSDRAVDPDGGFYGTLLNDGSPLLPSSAHSKRQTDKGSILNARILWTFASAYRIYGLESYRYIADRAARYYIDHFIDPKYGGVFWTVDAEGAISDATKQTYTAAFGIYGLSEYFRATGDRESLNKAIDIYETLEQHVHDKKQLGYREVFNRDYSQMGGEGIDGNRGSEKTMNTHIHVMEAFTNLYRVWPNEKLKSNILELIDLLGSRLYSPETHHLILFCKDDWSTLDRVDSYGHDIETAWLLCEAAEVIGDASVIQKTRQQALAMTDTALEEGLAPSGAMYNERNADGLDTTLSWWPQCETVVGCINAWQISGDVKYFNAAVKTWDYIKNHFIDLEHGGWYKILTDTEEPKLQEPKASLWNCPYHNSRMGFELKTRLVKPAVHTEVMAWSNITGVRMEGELIDFESSLRIGKLGEKMESSGRERQKNIRFRREGNTQVTITPMHGATITQTVTDVDTCTVACEWLVEGKEDLKEGVYFCLSLTPRYYTDAKIQNLGKVVRIEAPDRQIQLTFEKNVSTRVREEDGGKALYITLMPKIEKDAKIQLKATMQTSGSRHHAPVDIKLNAKQTGRQFAGFGGNFRIQNVRKDSQVIDYCLDHLKVAFGRVEFPWALWDQQGDTAAHVIRSAKMARKLKAANMPLIVSCWFPPQWAGTQTTRSDGTARAFALKPEEKEHIFASIASYLTFLKQQYGAEADYFSFNESDLGIDIVHTPQEHCDFIKEFGAYMASKGLKTLMLLGDNSDATTFDFILPALNDPAAHKYIGAISFHSWRGCDDATLAKWAEASRQLNVPLIVGEGSTDAAAHQYPQIFNESTFALYEINLYTRLCAQCQPLSILQWQLTSDYSLMWGDGIYGSEGPMRPTQRFWNIRQLSLTPSYSFSVPATHHAEDINIAAFSKPATSQYTVHMVNNAASRVARISGFPTGVTEALIYITNSHQNAEAQLLSVKKGVLEVMMPAESFVTVLAE